MKKMFVISAVIAVLLFCLGPVLWQVITSLKPSEEAGRLPPVLPERATLEHYRMLLADPAFLRIILNSFGIAAITTILSIMLGAPAAFGLAKLNVPFRRLVLPFILSVSMFPPIATVSPLYLIMRWLGLRDTWWALIVIHTTFSLPLTIWILTNFFRSIPDEIYRASRVDGCAPLQTFLHIMLPLAAPGLVTASLLVFIFSWNEFLYALTFTATTTSRTIPVAIALFPGQHEVPWAGIAAASVIVILPLVLIVLLFQRRIIEGLTAGAVKG